MFSQRDLIDMKEACDLSGALSGVPRWQRKLNSSQVGSSKTPSKSSKTPNGKKTPAVSAKGVDYSPAVVCGDGDARGSQRGRARCRDVGGKSLALQNGASPLPLPRACLPLQ